MWDAETTAIGKIVEFFPETQTATIELLVSQIVSTEQSNFNDTDIAHLEDVPIKFPKVQNFVITLPVKAGDKCEVSFHKYGITHWLYENLEAYRVTRGRPEPAALRRYSLQDATAEVTLSSFLDPITDFSPDDLVIRNKENTQSITLRPNGETHVKTGDCSILLKPNGELVINAVTSVTVETPETIFTGNVRVEGNTSIGGDMSTDEKGSFNDHVHPTGTYKDALSRPLLVGTYAGAIEGNG